MLPICASGERACGTSRERRKLKVIAADELQLFSAPTGTSKGGEHYQQWKMENYAVVTTIVLLHCDYY